MAIGARARGTFERGGLLIQSPRRVGNIKFRRVLITSLSASTLDPFKRGILGTRVLHFRVT